MHRRLLPIAPALLLACTDCGSSGGGGSASEYSACIQAETAAQNARIATQVAPPKGPFSANLLETKADALEVAIRDQAKREMRASVESSRTSRIATLRCEHLRPKRELASAADAPNAVPVSAAGAGESDGSGGARQVSGTNNQVAGVDEADFVKNDSKYIYVVKGSRFRIVEAWPAPEAHEIANVIVPGEAKKLFVEGDRALVYSSIPKSSPTSTGAEGYAGRGGASAPSSGSGECTYGYEGCVPSGDGTETELSVYDIADRAAPRLIRSIHSSSSLVAARRIGNAVHTVLGEPSAMTAGYSTYPTGLSGYATEREINAAFDRLVAENTAKLDAIEVGTVLPKWSDSAGRSPNLSLYQSSMPDGTSLTSVLSIDLLTDAEVKIASVIGRAGWVYASGESLYIAVPHQQVPGWGWYENRTEPELSTIHKFSIGTAPAATSYVATGVVKGRVLNQFAMDEERGALRVATTTGRVPSPDVHSTISVFQPAAGTLEVVGQVDHIAKTEDIRSVRFDGSRGYIVTFKKTDPLFVFDLADPRAPKILGELKIPGFSTYMHMMDATHLLTIGYDAADHGSFAFFTGVLLQIFDVSNPSDPKLAHKEVIGTRGSSSEALTNHLAFNYFAPKNLLAVPMTVCEGGDQNGGYGTAMTFSGLMVYDTTVATGFSLRGKVAHPNASAQTNVDRNTFGYYDQGCSNWWTNASSEVKRSIIMDDYVFSVSDRRIKVNDLRALGSDVKELPLE